MLRLGHRPNDAAGVILGHLCCARCLLYRGEFGQSKSHLEAGLALYDPTAHRPLVDQTGAHPQVYLQGYLAWVLFWLGYPDQAFARSNAAIAEARRLAHPPSLAAGLSLGALLLSLDGNDAALNERAQELVAVATEQGFPFWLAWGTMLCGWVKVRSGDVTEGMSLLRGGWAVQRATGAEPFAPYL
jgi:adenylate cyclase